MENLSKDPEVLELLKRVDSFKAIDAMAENYTLIHADKRVIGTKECFGKAIRKYEEIADGRSPENVTINITVNFRKLVTREGYKDSIVNNFTLMNPEQFKEHMSYLEKLGLKFKYTVYEKSDKVKLELYTPYIRSNAQLRFILFWVRSAYAFPYNLFLLDAYTLNEKYKEIGLHNLVPLTICSCGRVLYFANIYPDVKLISAEELATNLRKNRYVASAYGRIQASTTFRDLVETKYSGKIERVNPLSSVAGLYRKPQAIKWLENETRFTLYDKILELKQNDSSGQ